MARKLKTFQTSLGFYDLAIAAPSMKAALGAWGADSNLFHQGAAKESEDPDVIAATMEKPGVVLKRPVGSSGAFRENAQLPIDLAGERRAVKANRKSSNHRAQKRAADPAADRNAALAFEREEKRRARERTKRRLSSARSRSDGKTRSRKRKGPSTPPVRSMKTSVRISKPSWMLSRKGLKPRIPVGRRRAHGSKPCCGGRKSKRLERVAILVFRWTFWTGVTYCLEYLRDAVHSLA